MTKAITGSNIISSEEYKAQVCEITEYLSKIISRTAGPCGDSALIEEFGPLVATKDGFHVAKHIHLDPHDILANNILSYVLRMSHRMVSLVGDGSSAAIIAAHKFIKLFNESQMKTTRPRDLKNRIQYWIDALAENIQKSATFPTAEEMADIMYKTALVSTNGDTAFATIMRNIYKETGDGQAVKFRISKGTPSDRETTYELIDGYKNRYGMLNAIFYNAQGRFEAKDVRILMFDKPVTEYDHQIIVTARQLLAEGLNVSEIPELLVIAPAYQQDFVEIIDREVKREFQHVQAGNLKHISTRYMKALTVNNHLRNQFFDFAALCGCTPIKVADFNAMVDPLMNTYTPDIDLIKESIGGIGYIRATGDECIIKDFVYRKEEEWERVIQQVTEVYQQEALKNQDSQYPSVDYINYRQRYQSLMCKMVEIVIGAPNETDRVLLFDAADDATRACESVSEYGYVQGGNTAIIKEIDKIVNAPEKQSTLDFNVLTLLRNTFLETVGEVFANKYTADGFDSLPDDKKKEIFDIINGCVINDNYYDLITGETTVDIINSARTDIEILRGSISMATTLITSSQYVMQGATMPVEK